MYYLCYTQSSASSPGSETRVPGSNSRTRTRVWGVRVRVQKIRQKSAILSQNCPIFSYYFTHFSHIWQITTFKEFFSVFNHTVMYKSIMFYLVCNR